MSRLLNARPGVSLNQPIRGFPLFFGSRRASRVITGDIWAYLRHVCQDRLRSAPLQEQAISFIEQAFDFYMAATNHRQSSRPLLYYYAFLNLAKVYLIHEGVKLYFTPHHGISDPRANTKQRLRFKGQTVQCQAIGSQHANVFPEFHMAQCKHSCSGDKCIFKVTNLLSQIPAVHRTYCSVMSQRTLFCPVNAIELLHSNGQIWAALLFKKNESDVQATLNEIRKQRRFSRCFNQVTWTQDNEHLAFETKPEKYVRRDVDKAIGRLANNIRSVGIWTILTQSGYRYYLSTLPDRTLIPQMCSAYAVMYYLGSITRYKPYAFDKIVKGYSWLISEFLDTQPEQFIHLLASLIARSEVVMPQALSVKAF